MFKRIIISNLSVKRFVIRRTFLSDAYSCQEAWHARLTTPILEKINHDSLYYELEQKFHQKVKVSAIDIDIYTNKLADDSHVEEVADLMAKFRLTEEASNIFDSTHHAIIRNYVDHGHYAELIELLNNRLAYGIFFDEFTANLTLHRLITTNDFKWAARIATLLGLQEDFTNPITRSLALYACYRYVKSGKIDHFDDLVPPPLEESIEGKKKKKQEIKVRVKFIRNEFFDDHFDIKDSKLLLGKTFFLLGLNSEELVGSSCKLLGLVLYEKYAEAIELIRLNTDAKFNVEVLKLVKTFLEGHEHKDNVDYVNLTNLLETDDVQMKINDCSFEQILIENIDQIVANDEQKQIEQQKKMYNKWCELRQQRLETELARLNRAKRIQDIERMTQDMEQEEQKLWFFENEDNIDLQIDSKKVFYPKRWFGKKKKPRVVDEDYVPPEVRQRQG
ncbi:uncharacterized protein LOC131436436 [Malaya genurostris]|uniref:uncharacterized protein LOC131436436 n=1 Tax=Malaya genurostris TaxID=325434 RepID=UPI0026F3CA97|nr:uncharacterized protein LOC131436436 [Malaya genurostris]